MWYLLLLMVHDIFIFPEYAYFTSYTWHLCVVVICLFQDEEVS